MSRICIFVVCAFAFSFADKVLAGYPDVFSRLFWQSDTLATDSLRAQMNAVTMTESVNVYGDTCFLQRVEPNPYVFSHICLENTNDYGIISSLTLCAPDSLVTFATFNDYLIEQVDWLDSINAIHMTI
ncbi:MAG TPA: hypothetical protein VLM37_07250 [Fibrobacteraceae bacterium]|nr:hypothetical protein [Fibrobacteraceae bacterium]